MTRSIGKRWVHGWLIVVGILSVLYFSYLTYYNVKVDKVLTSMPLQERSQIALDLLTNSETKQDRLDKIEVVYTLNGDNTIVAGIYTDSADPLELNTEIVKQKLTPLRTLTKLAVPLACVLLLIALMVIICFSDYTNYLIAPCYVLLVILMAMVGNQSRYALQIDKRTYNELEVVIQHINANPQLLTPLLNEKIGTSQLDGVEVIQLYRVDKKTISDLLTDNNLTRMGKIKLGATTYILPEELYKSDDTHLYLLQERVFKNEY